MRQKTEPYLTPEDYLFLERNAETKSEYFDGETFAMSEASEAHNLIVANLVMVLGLQVKLRPCKIYASDMRVKVQPSDLYTYPDVVVVCGKAEFGDEYVDTLINPTVILEVLSPSTEAYDRGRKFEHYRHLASVSDYLLISQHVRAIDHFVRQADGLWLLAAYRGVDAVVIIDDIACELPLADVFDKLDLPDDDSYSVQMSVIKEREPDWEPVPPPPPPPQILT